MRIRIKPCVLFTLAAVTIRGAAAQDQPKSDQQPEHMAPAMNMVEMNPASMFLMNLASGTSANPGVLADADDHDALQELEHHVHGARLPIGYPAIRTTRGRQNLLDQLVYGLSGAPSRIERRVPGRGNAQPGSGHSHESSISVALSDRRNSLRCSARGLPASAQFHHVVGI